MTNNNASIAKEWWGLSHEERSEIINNVYSNMSAAGKKSLDNIGKGIIRNLSFMATSRRGEAATAKMAEVGVKELIAMLGVWMGQNNYKGE